MNSFLFQVATYLYSNFESDFEHIKLILPNRRSGVFLEKHLQEIINKTIWLPEILTINDFFEEQTKLITGEHIQLLAELYKNYLKVAKSQETFDEFYFWGEIILNDFNDVDKYLINADAVFSNIKELKNIDSSFDYLTDEQKNVLKRFFSEFDPEKNSKLKENFLQIWNFLLPLYKSFNEELFKKGIAYEGMLYRDTVTRIENSDFNQHKTKYFFIGFNAITKCEEKIFEHLKTHQVASFFWDFDNYYIDNKLFEAGFFLRNYLKKFAPPNDFKLESNNLKKPKEIKIISVPTNDGQVFYAGKHIHNNPQNDYSNTALVLADETLLGTVLNYLPKNVSDVNITMGYPVKDTLTGSFIDLIIALKNTKGNNSNTFYYKNILPLLRHPYINAVAQPEALELIKKIKSENLISISTNDIANFELFNLMFSESPNSKTFSEQLSKTLYYIQEKISPLVEQGKFQLDFEQLYNIYLTINKLQNQLTEQGIDISLPIYCKLLRKMLYSLRIPFEGEPVKGLQIMGFLETRNLDFENIIILSTNDSLLPSTNITPSFIPYGLRKGFSLPTRELHDAMYAYYFYRIIQRAKNISLVYNSSVGGLTTGEKSRFIHQLEYDNSFNIKEYTENYTIDMMVKKPTEINKTGLVKDRLNVYLDNKTPKTLSPSAIVTYLSCSLKFYYQNILRLREEDELTESVDARLFGNIFHHAAEYIYQPYEDSGKDITEIEINNIISNKEIINKAIQHSFTKTFSGDHSKREFKIRGKNTLVFNIIKKYLTKMLQFDSNEAPLKIIGLEKSLYRNIGFQINDQSFNINIGGQIDRLDKTSEGLRIIDYKTGNDKLFFKTITEVFSVDKIIDYKAILQTLIYGYVCSEHFPNETSIIPGIYKVKDLFKNDFSFRIKSKEETNFENSNFIKIEDQVSTELRAVLTQLFDYNIPFKPTENEKHCSYCSFKTMCGR